MRRMRAKARAATLATIAAAALAAPLLAAPAANALLIPKADLSIVKSVGSHGPTQPLNADLSDTGENAHLEWVDDGLRLYIYDDPDTCVSMTPPNAVACDDALEKREQRFVEYIDTDTPLSSVAAASAPNLIFSTSPSNPVGAFFINLLVDTNGNGDPELLLGRPAANPGAAWAGYAFPLPAWPASPLVARNLVPANLLPGGVNGGTLTAWLNSLPPGSTVTAFGFGTGPNLLSMDATLERFSFAGQDYSFARVFKGGVKAAPGDTVSYQLVISNGSSVDPSNKAAQAVQVADVLPPSTTYVASSLKVLVGGQWVAPSASNWPCSFANNMLSCSPRTFAKGETQALRFQATLDENISAAGLPATEGHWVDVQHKSNATVINKNQTRTISVACPADYLATDGGLLLDQVDGAADVVIEASREQVTQSGADGWAVRATNIGDSAVAVTAEVTCLDVVLGASAGHTHQIDALSLPWSQQALTGSTTKTVQMSCPAGYTPYAPGFETDLGVATIRESYAVDNTWYWVVDPGESSSTASFVLSCLAPQTDSDSGHTASLVIATPDDTISVGPETQTEGIMACPADSNAIVGGYGGYTADVRSLGAEPRGDKYMFRFYNADPDAARNADIQVTCVGALTAQEPTYVDVVNTASVSTTTKDRDYSDNIDSAGVAVNGDPAVNAPSGVILTDLGVKRTLNSNDKATALKMQMRCTKVKPCTFTVKAFKAGTLVASKTTSLAGLASKEVSVPTNSAGRNLPFGAGLVVKIKTTSGITSYDVGVIL